METMIDGTLSYDTNYDAVQKEIMICGRNLINLEKYKIGFHEKKNSKRKGFRPHIQANNIAHFE